MTELEIRRLISEIRDELSALAKVRALLEEAHKRFAEHAPGSLELGGIALHLHAFYNGVENIFRRVALELGEGLPGGEDWHSQLLRNMAMEIPRVRPRVISEETRDRLEEFLRFRHVVRHAYGHELKWRWLQELLDGFGPAYTGFVEDSEEFLRFLEVMAEE
ncbi:MAG: hypothetical protein QHJ81_10540 [Anaerolineae bacterium]|nr:hypothetical protein [Anaerolineae bacterium]